MEIALIPGLFVAIFSAGAALILWWPYDAPKGGRLSLRAGFPGGLPRLLGRVSEVGSIPTGLTLVQRLKVSFLPD